MNSPEQGSVTHRAIARAAGVHPSTVSLALRNDCRLRRQTRDRVRAVAERLGYSENPLVSLLMAGVRRGNASYRGTLAFVSTAPAGLVGTPGPIWSGYFAGARHRAGQLGYKLDQFFLPTGHDGPVRMTRLLLARNVDGLIIHHRPTALCPDRRLPFDASPFCAVSIGVPLLHPRLNYIANDHFMRPVIAVRELLALGYRRPGLIVEHPYDGRGSHRCSAGFWAVQEYACALERIPILRLEAGSTGDSLEHWLRRYRPDVVLGALHWVPNELRARGRLVPDEFGWVDLDWNRDNAPAAGVHGNAELIGSEAVGMLVSQIRRGERRFPDQPVCHFVPGSWVAGATVRRVGPSVDLDASFFSDDLTQHAIRSREPVTTLSTAG